MVEPETTLLEGRFRLRRCLGTGGFGTVYEALDEKRRSVVAVKLLRHHGADELLRFKREFRTMCGLTHPNLVTLYELHSDAGKWFFSMELLPGQPWLRYVRGAGGGREPGWLLTPDDSAEPPLRTVVSGQDLIADPTVPPAQAVTTRVTTIVPELLLPSLLQLIAGLRALHDSGVVHRDIKPSNVLCTGEGRVVLLDFGLALLPAEQRAEAGISGTPDYMAPEQALGQSVTPASDLYAVGVLLYEALSGRLPFAGTPQQVLRQKVVQEPAPLPAPQDAVAAALGTLCWRLLQRAPERRPSLDTLQAELQALYTTRDPEIAGNRRDSRADSPPPRSKPFVGRDQELTTLRRALETSSSGTPTIVSCVGGSGVGKSALCKQFLKELTAPEHPAVVLVGSCYEHEDVPFKALDGVIDALCQYLRRLPRHQLVPLLPQEVGALARLFPVLRQVAEIAAAPAPQHLDDAQVRLVACAALRALWRRLGARGPLVICIDDLQWGDLDGTTLLLELLRPPQPLPLLLLVTYRSGEESSSTALDRFLRGLRRELGRVVQQHVINLPELGASAAQTLARALLPSASDEHIAAITAEAGGNALFIAELSRAAAADRPATFATARTSAADPPSSDLRRTALDELIRRRVARLPAASRQLLLSVAIAGQPVSRQATRQATYGELAETDEPQALAQLRAERLIRVRLTQAPPAASEPGEELLPYHDRVREAVLAKLAPTERSAQHLRLARALEHCGHAEPEQLVFHLQAGGEKAGAARYALQASTLAFQSLSYHLAVRLCKAALATDCLSREEVQQVRVRLAEALVGAGRPKEASTTYLGLAAGSTSQQALRWQHQAVRQLFIGGYIPEAHQALRRLLHASRLRVPRSQLAVVLCLLFYRLLLRLRGHHFRPRAESEIPAHQLLRIDTCEAIGASSTVTPLLASYFWLRCLWYALQAGEPRRISVAMSTEALMLSAFGGSRGRAKRVQQESLQIAQRSADAYAQGRSICTAAYIAHMEGRWRESAAIFRRSVELLKGQAREATLIIDFINVLQLYNLRWLGELRQISEDFPACLMDAHERGRQSQELFAQLAVGFLLPLSDDEPALAEELVSAAELRIAGQPFNSQHMMACEARLLILLYRGKANEAWSLYTQRKRMLVRSGLLRMDFFQAVWCYLRGILALSSGQPRRVVLRAAQQLTRVQVSFAAPLRTLLLALLRRRQGQHRAALQLITAAEAGFAACEMALYVACVQLCRSAWMGGAEGAALGEAARGFMNEQGIRRPERMAAMFLPCD